MLLESQKSMLAPATTWQHIQQIGKGSFSRCGDRAAPPQKERAVCCLPSSFSSPFVFRVVLARAQQIHAQGDDVAACFVGTPSCAMEVMHSVRPLRWFIPLFRALFHTAVKIVEKASAIAAGRVHRVFAEKEALGRCEHRHICALLGTSKDDEHLYFHLEPVLGGSLDVHTRACAAGPQAGMPTERVAVYAVQLLGALQHLFEQRVVHRDVKPQNLLLDGRGHVKLCDFSCCKCFDRTDTECARTFTHIGTPRYMAPEMWSRAGHSFAVDWWAAGVVLAELVCGATPQQHAGDSDAARLCSGSEHDWVAGLLAVLEEERLPGQSRLKQLIRWRTRSRAIVSCFCWCWHASLLVCEFVRHSGLLSVEEETRLGATSWQEAAGTDFVERWTVANDVSCDQTLQPLRSPSNAACVCLSVHMRIQDTIPGFDESLGYLHLAGNLDHAVPSRGSGDGCFRPF